MGGEKEFEGSYVDGKKDGVWSYFYSTGEKSFEVNFGSTPLEFYKEFDEFLNKSDKEKQNILKVN